MLKTGVTLLSLSQGFRERQGPTTMGGLKVYNYQANAQEWTILFRPDTTDATIRDICRGSCALMGAPDKGGVAYAKFDGDEKELRRLIKGRQSLVEMVEVDQEDFLIPDLEEEDNKMSIASTSPWGLDSIGVSSQSGTGVGVHIYVQDTGVRPTHTDFGGRVIPTIDLTSGRVKECSDSWLSRNCARDGQGHGTHCAGTAAGEAYGVAKRATIHAVKTLSDSGGGARSWQYSAISWVTENGESPAVISMSLGGSGADPMYNNFIGAATNKGITVVVAAGNSNSDSCGFSPAFAAQAITVGATTSTNERASYSNFGECNDIMAPGSGVKSADGFSDGGSKSLSGTSMACPHVSGAAALLLEGNPSMNRDAILEILLVSAKEGVVQNLMPGDPDKFLWVR